MKILKYALPIFFLVAVISGCEKEGPTAPKVPVPEITSIGPDTLYGGQPLTIKGSNFNPDPNENLIRFGYSSSFGYTSVRADSGTTTTLKLITPQVGGMEDITTEAKVSNLEGTKWSNGLDITFQKIVSIFVDDLADTKGGITFDADGNCYVQVKSEGGKIYKITPDGEESEYCSGIPTFVGGEMGFGPDGYLYITSPWTDWQWDVWDAGGGGIYRVPPGGGDAEEYISGDVIWHPRSIDWDDNGNMYAMATYVWQYVDGTTVDGSLIFRVTPDKDIGHLFDATSNLGWGACLRVFNGYLYWYERQYKEWYNNTLGLKRAPITANGVGAPEVVFESDKYTPSGIAIDDGGNTYLIGGWGNYNIIKITPDGVDKTVASLATENPNFAAFYGDFLYIEAGWAGGTIYKLYLGTGGVPPHK